MGKLKAGQTYHHKIKFAGNGIYAFLIDGEVDINDLSLQRRDAVGYSNLNELKIEVNQDSTLLLIEIPINY